MSDRFFCPHISDSSVTLTDAEAHHALHVRRLKAGDSLRLFDGAGTTAEAVVKQTGRQDLTVSVLTKSYVERRSVGRVSVAACVPRGDRVKWMVEKLTEIGVDRFIPLHTERSSGLSAAKLRKLSATVIAAAKQCRRSWLMEIGQMQPLNELLKTADQAASLVIAHPPGPDDACQLKVSGRPNCDVIVLIGPEGGFTDEEVAAAEQKSAARVTWPGGILRTETAAVVVAALVLAGRPLTRE